MSTKERLFIRKIEIENVGRFYGTGHTIMLSDSSEKNITIIIGDSGRGKSTIHDLIYWCLYGEYKKHSNNDKIRQDYGLVNTDALESMKKDERVKASVTLSLCDDREEKYLLTRELIATYNHDSIKRRFEPQNNSHVPAGIDFETITKLKMKDNTGNMVIEKNPKMISSEIKKYFPQHLSDFFLFDGENLIKFQKSQSSSDFIRNGITKISGLEILDDLSETAKDTASGIQKHIGGKSTQASPHQANVDRLNRQITDLGNEEKELEQKERKFYLLHEEISNKIRQSKDGQKLLDDQRKIEVRKKTASRELRQVENNIKETLFEKIPQLLMRGTLQKCEGLFVRLEEEDKIPPSISRGALDKILNSEPLRCVCGREFEKNENEDEPWMVLSRIKNVIIEDDLSQGISLGRDLISRIIDVTTIKKISEDYYCLTDTRRERRRTIKELTAEYDDLDEQIKEIQMDKAEDLGERKKEYGEKYLQCKIDIRLKKEELEVKKNELEKENNALQDALDKENKYGNEMKKIKLATTVSKFIRELEKRIEETIRNRTQQATSKYFLESAPEKESFDRICIDQNYDITVEDSRGLNSGLSKGQSHVLGLSYVAGIREITHTNTFLIIDSPLHNISGTSRNEISEVFSKYLPGVQIVLLVTDTEYLHGDSYGAEPVKDVLKRTGRIWKEYIIKQEHVHTKHDDDIDSRKIEEYVR